MASFLHKLLLLTLLFLLSFTASSEGLSLGRKRRHITIKNGLESGPNLDLTVNCKSGETEIGVKTLPKDGVYEFSFRPKVLPRTTLFFCTFRALKWKGFVRSYDVWYDGIDCSRCDYLVRDSDICRRDPKTNQYDICKEVSSKSRDN